ncbi:serine/threonine-protein kinase [Fodinicola feengrottensis]|uniref:serine/threonine-protein kinase n=1 Tax=Fodinicola feengrottensis TaxID=435914 RepID=UPI0013D37AF9|nr:serine/threonine-protein kinase [Fodinicola feengrottensis]
MTGPTGRVPISPVPGYSNLRVLARGGYATVYVATQTSIGREVALKIDTRSVEDERDRRRFLREAQAAGRLSAHPNIVPVYDAGVTGDSHPYLIMELCTGGSYAALLKRNGPLEERRVRDIGVKIAGALSAAHSAGILHRDVKPGNILIRAFGEPGLADFGLASMLHSQRYTSLALDALTPAYSAPEVFKAERRPTTAADVYSLGATLYALLTGSVGRRAGRPAGRRPWRPSSCCRNARSRTSRRCPPSSSRCSGIRWRATSTSATTPRTPSSTRWSRCPCHRLARPPPRCTSTSRKANICRKAGTRPVSRPPGRRLFRLVTRPVPRVGAVLPVRRPVVPPPAVRRPAAPPSPAAGPVPQSAATGRMPIPGPLVRSPGYPPPAGQAPSFFRPGGQSGQPGLFVPSPGPGQPPARPPAVPPVPLPPGGGSYSGQPGIAQPGIVQPGVSGGGPYGGGQGYPVPPPQVGRPTGPYVVTARPSAGQQPAGQAETTFLSRFSNGQLVLITAGVVVAAGIVIAAVVAVVLILNH